MSLRTDLFDYELPERLIAQTPAARRDGSRLLVVNRARHTIAHHGFADLPRFLRAGDVLFRNTAAVLPARLFAHRPTGGRVECLLLRPAAANEWWCLLRPGRRLAPGSTFSHEPDFSATVVERSADGTARVTFATVGGESVVALARRLGQVPLPPYIRHRHTEEERRLDRDRYQTVYADGAHPVAVAAPTAGLHFTPEILAQLDSMHVTCADLTLHVGLGTFRPIAAATIEEHPMHREIYELSPAAQRRLLAPDGGRRVAVGTTTVRAIEDALERHPEPLDRPLVTETALFIHPPRPFRGVDALITNFHQPRSTLLCLVAAFLSPGSTDGIAWIREIYAEAVARNYRFLSYGDAMLIL